MTSIIQELFTDSVRRRGAEEGIWTVLTESLLRRKLHKSCTCKEEENLSFKRVG